MTNIRRGTWSHLVMALCLLGPGSPAPAASTDETAQGTPEPAPRPKIGLALGGGGARGTAHIGVIRALEQMHVQIDYIAGTSMGSIIGGLYACGYTPDGMEKLVGSIDWDTLFRDAPGRKDQSFRQKEDDFLHLIPFEFGLNFNKGGLLLPPGLIAGSKLAFVLENATLPCSSVTNFDQLRIPFRAVATDVQTGEPYVMSSGNLARVIRASMAIPAIFTPVEIDGHELIDGGESQNLPVQTVRAMGADIVIAVNVGSSGKTRAEKVGNVGAMIGRLIDLPLQQNTMAAAKLADFVITPNLDPYTSADFGKGLKMAALGYQAALADKGKLEQWSEPESVYVPWKERHDATLPPMPRIDQVVVDAVPGIDPRRLQFLVHTRPGILDTKTLAEDLKRIYGLGYFEIVSYTIAQDGERTILRITATPKSWGPTYLKLGLNLATDFHLTTDFGFTALVDATEMNRLGGEWKTTATIGSPVDLETRFFQPVNHRGHLFLSPFISWQQYLVQLWNAEGTVTTGTDQVRRFAGGMDIGYDFGTWGELRVGYMASKRGGTKLVGTELANATQFTYDQGALGAQLRIDQLDNVNLPHSGYFADIGYLANRPSLGASSEVTRANGEVSDPHLSDYDLLAGKAVGVQTVGRWTGQVRGEYGTSLGTALPFLDRYTLGGLFRLSGRPIRQLRGENVLFGAGLLYYRVSGTGSGVVKNLSAGVSIEGGTTWTSRTDWQKVPWSEMRLAGSVYVIADTLIGPFFLGYGHSQGYGTLYLYLNRSF